MNGLKKLTQEGLDALVDEISYEVKGTMTICVVTLACGFRLVGHSACLNARDFDEEVGRRVARDHAMEGLWELEGYHRLRSAEETEAVLGAQRSVGGTSRPVGSAGMDFGGALQALREGFKVTRGGWNGKGQFIELQEPDAGSKMTQPYLFITTVDGGRVPWLASQTDMLAWDWFVTGCEAGS